MSCSDAVRFPITRRGIPDHAEVFHRGMRCPAMTCTLKALPDEAVLEVGSTVLIPELIWSVATE